MMRVELKGMKKGGDFITNNGRGEMSRHVPFWKDKFTDPVLAQLIFWDCQVFLLIFPKYI